MVRSEPMIPGPVGSGRRPVVCRRLTLPWRCGAAEVNGVLHSEFWAVPAVGSFSPDESVDAQVQG